MEFIHFQGLLKMDAQGLAANLIQNTVILSTAVELGVRWRELAERLGRLSSAQIAAYETPHRGKNGEVSAQVSPPHNSLEAFPETCISFKVDDIGPIMCFLVQNWCRNVPPCEHVVYGS